MAFRLPTWADKTRTGLWCPAFPQIDLPACEDEDLDELLMWIVDGGIIEAHNAFFERGVFTNIMGPRYGWPVPDANQWRCSAAKCAAHALPRGLEDAGAALGLSVLKDTVGGKLMKKLSKPRKSRKKEREDWLKLHGDAPMPILWWEKREWFQQLFDYCRQDVLAEEAISAAVPDLSDRELRVYLTDQVMNSRGFALDVEGVAVAQQLLAQEQETLNAEIGVITDGAVTKATQRAKLTRWCDAQGVRLFDTTAETLEGVLLSNDLPDAVRRALTILQALGRSSTAKYEAMSKWACPDNRVHGLLLYHGASTGRWSGAGIQPQNFPKGSIEHWDMEIAWDIIKTGDREFIRTVFGGVMETLSQALRGAMVATPGKELYVADYASIEARVLLWLAEDDDALDVFRRGEDIYCDMASAIYDRPITKKDKVERGMGKIAVLGLGFGMGPVPGFTGACLAFGITVSDDFSRKVVEAYREKYYRVKRLWAEQEERAIQAVRNPGYEIPTGHVAWTMGDRYLYCVLPSGRRLAYPEPEVRMTKTSWGSIRPQLTFMGVNPLNRKWCRQHTYGGMLVENITQAVARDLLAEAVLRCADSDRFTPLLTVHDELIAEGEPGFDILEFETLVAEVPTWARGCPVKAEGFVSPRYKK